MVPSWLPDDFSILFPFLIGNIPDFLATFPMFVRGGQPRDGAHEGTPEAGAWGAKGIMGIGAENTSGPIGDGLLPAPGGFGKNLFPPNPNFSCVSSSPLSIKQ